ncbi:hypothetical protein Tco_0574181 [Tanacetum coccineum]
MREYMASHTERVERFKEAMLKQRDRINGRMAKMFKKEDDEVIDENIIKRSESRAEIKFDKGIITLKSGKSKVNFHKWPEIFCKFEEKKEDKIEALSIVNKHILEWEESIMLHHEKGLEFDQWRNKMFNNKNSMYKDESSSSGRDENQRGVTKDIIDDSLDDSAKRNLQGVLTLRVEDDWKGYWPSIGDGKFVVRATIAKKIRDPIIRLAHHFLTTTILGLNSSTQRITAIDMFYLYCIYTEGIVCNISYWLARYLKRARDMSVLCGGMFVTKIAQSFVLLSKEMVDTLSMDPRARTFTKKSLIVMDVIMELDEGNYCWPAVRGVREDDEMEEEAEEPVGAYRGMNRGDW